MHISKLTINGPLPMITNGMLPFLAQLLQIMTILLRFPRKFVYESTKNVSVHPNS